MENTDPRTFLNGILHELLVTKFSGAHSAVLGVACIVLFCFSTFLQHCMMQLSQNLVRAVALRVWSVHPKGPRTHAGHLQNQNYFTVTQRCYWPFLLGWHFVKLLMVKFLAPLYQSRQRLQTIAQSFTTTCSQFIKNKVISLKSILGEVVKNIYFIKSQPLNIVFCVTK